MKKSISTIAVVLSTALFAGCAQLPNLGSSQGSSTAGSTSSGKKLAAQTCASPMGTVAIDMDTSQSWYSIFTSQYQLPSLVPVIRLIVQQSNCFVVVDRSTALNQSMQERQLSNEGLLRSNSNYHGQQIVAADYTLEPSVTFTNNNMAGVAGLLGAFIPGAGTVAASVNMKQAQASLVMVDNRSSVQLAAATGTGQGLDIGGFDAGTIGNKYGSLGAYATTAQGKVVLAAFIDAYAHLVQSVKAYRAQHIAGGMGTGGALQVQGASSGVTASQAPALSLSVRDAQLDLNELGYSVGRPDGIMGPHTRSELRQFQAASHLPATGLLDAPTAQALQKQTAR